MDSESFSTSQKDIYLVSYPRSGNTWMRAMIAEILYGTSGKSLEDLDYYVPDIYLKKKQNEVVPALFHVIKSHALCIHPWLENFLYKKVIYIVRDPRDTLLSHFWYHKHLRKYPGDFEDFIVDWLFGRIFPCSWGEHVNSWTLSGQGQTGPYYQLCLVRYEDLATFPVRELKKVIEFIGLQRSECDLEKAVNDCSADLMRKKEVAGKRVSETNEGFEFIGPAKPGAWREILSRQQNDLILTNLANSMKRFAYVF